MSDIPYGFEKPIAKRLRDTVRGSGDTIPPEGQVIEQRRVAICLTPSGGIPARSGTTPGTATIALCQIEGTTITTTEIEETGYNIDCEEIPGEEYTSCRREYVGGKWVVDQLPITDLRLDGSNLQYKRGCTWYTWTTGTSCP